MKSYRERIQARIWFWQYKVDLAKIRCPDYEERISKNLYNYYVKMLDKYVTELRLIGDNRRKKNIDFIQ